MSNTQQNEQLSAFVDGELAHSSEQAELSAQLLQDRQFRQKMARYQQIGDAMRQQANGPIDATEIIDRIQIDLENEPHLLAPQPQKTRKFQKVSQVAWGAGIAATVAAIAIVIAPQFLNPNISPSEPSFVQVPLASSNSTHNSTTQQGVLVSSQGATSSSAGRQTLEGQQWKRLSPDQLQQIDRYMVEHQEFSGIARMGRPSSHVNFVAVSNADQ